MLSIAQCSLVVVVGGGLSQLSLTVELLGNLKDPTPSPQPQGFPLTKLGGASGTKSFF